MPARREPLLRRTEWPKAVRPGSPSCRGLRRRECERRGGRLPLRGGTARPHYWSGRAKPPRFTARLLAGAPRPSNASTQPVSLSVGAPLTQYQSFPPGSQVCLVGRLARAARLVRPVQCGPDSAGHFYGLAGIRATKFQHLECPDCHAAVPDIEWFKPSCGFAKFCTGVFDALGAAPACNLGGAAGKVFLHGL